MVMPSVLIIEDDADSRRAIGKLFARADWKVLEAVDGDAGVEVAIRNQPEVILCDLLMPKSNGFQVCRTIRQQLQPTKIIVVSGRDYAVDRASAQELFQVPEHYILFADSSPMIWHMLRDALIDSVFMSIARLLDPPTSCGKDNLSVSRILQNMPSGAERDQTQRQYDELLGLYDSALRLWRNRKLSHNELKTIKRMSPLPTIPFPEISELINKINELGRRIGHIVQAVDKSFKPHISNKTGCGNYSKL
jgi:CheY-like chemotaxis protein